MLVTESRLQRLRALVALTGGLLAAGAAGAARADEKFVLSLPAVSGPTDAIVLRLRVTSEQEEITRFGTRITYDPSRVELVDFEKGSDIPSRWVFTYSKTSEAGLIDLVLGRSGSDPIEGPVTGLDCIRITFERVGLDCSPSKFGFFEGTPAPGSQFPFNNYIRYHAASGGSDELEPDLVPASGPLVDDHSFIRGNVNNQGASRLHLDVQDVVDLAAMLFGGQPPIACEAAMDTNDDGKINISDLVTQVQGIFNGELIRIRPPSSEDPGPDTPGIVVPDGGSLPSELGCAVGQACL